MRKAFELSVALRVVYSFLVKEENGILDMYGINSSFETFELRCSDNACINFFNDYFCSRFVLSPLIEQYILSI